MKATCTLLFLLFLANPLSSFGWAGPISFPELPYYPGMATNQQDKITEVQEYLQTDLEFIDGMFSDPFYTNQRFRGTAEKTTGFLELLKKVALWNMQLKIKDFGEQDSAFSMHSTQTQLLVITLNSGRDDFRLKDFAPYIQFVDIPATP